MGVNLRTYFGMPMHPIFGEQPLWLQCLLFAGLLIVTLFGMGAVIAFLPANAYQVQALVNALGIALLPSILFALLVYENPWRQSGFGPSSSGWFYPLAVFMMLVAIPMIQVMASWNENLHLPKALGGIDQWIHDTEQTQDGFVKRMLNMPNTASLLLNLFTMAFCTAVGEEAFFRGVIQKILVRATRRMHVAVWLGAILFSALHFQFLGFFPRVLLGLVLGYLYAYSGSLWPSILAHFVYNGSQILYFYFQQHQGPIPSGPVYDNNATMPLSYGLLSTILVLGGFMWMKRIKPNTWP
jgi:membrane protease YdiL (CAAX protease family)